MKSIFFKILSIAVASVLYINNACAQIITTIVGTGSPGYSGDGIAATSAKINDAPRIAVDACGNVYIGDAGNNRVRMVDAKTGIITTIAGTGIAGYNGDSIAATIAQLSTPTCLAFDKAGNLYIGDGGNDRIRKVNMLTGIITTYVGTGTLGFSGDGGPATAALIRAGDMAIDPYGNMYMCDYRRIRKIDTAGIITTIAGTGLPGVTVLGVPATSTNIHPYPAIATDTLGNIFTVDSIGVILKITANTGILTKVAGVGITTTPYTGDGIQATSCTMNPDGLYVDDTGSIFAACPMNNICIKIDTFGYTHTIAGNGTSGYGGDGGTATTAKLYYPQDITFDRYGHMYIADWINNRIRKVTYPYTLTSPSISLSGVVSAPVGTSVTITATISGASPEYIIHWMNHGIEFTTTTVPTVTYTKPAGIDTITARIVATCGFYDSTTSAGHVVTDPATEGVITLANANLKIYPNPANEILYIDGLQSQASFRLLNVVGTVMKNGCISPGNNSVRVQSLPQGVYILELVTGDEEKTITKIIKQ